MRYFNKNRHCIIDHVNIINNIVLQSIIYKYKYKYKK